MEPLSVVGLLAASLQFVEQGSKFISIAKQFLEGAAGFHEMKSVKSALEAVSLRLSVEASRHSPLRQSTEDQDMLRLTKQCLDLAEEINELIDKCRPKRSTKLGSPSARLGSTLAAAGRMMLKKSKIEDLQSRLSRLEDALALQLAAITRSEVRQCIDKLQELGFQGQTQLLQVKRIQESLAAGVTVAKFNTQAIEELKRIMELVNNANLEARQRQRILAALSSSATDERYVEIVEPFPETFAYMLDDDEQLLRTHPDLKISFKEWLLRGEGIFHISGKPGAGKSTLMKMLCEDERTADALTTWAGPTRKLVFAKFFFWKYGTTPQRSLQGFYRAILREVLLHCPDLLSSLFPGHQNISVDMSSKDVEPGFNQLLELVNDVNHTNYRFCFFIDGLDEFEENVVIHSDLVATLQRWADNSKGNIKLCVSSRELPAFRRLPIAQKIRLQLLTQHDIELFVHGQLVTLEEFQELRSEGGDAEEQCDDFFRELVSKAEGVFLWVSIVVRSLRKGLIDNGDSIYKLRQKLDLIPSDLDKFFQYMLEAIELPYRKDAYATFAVAMKLAKSGRFNSLSLLRYSFLFDWLENPRFHEKVSLRHLTSRGLDLRLDKAVDRLGARCNSLLEIQRLENSKYKNEPTHRDIVKFIHRSAPDWLDVHLKEFVQDFDVAQAILQTLLAQIRFGCLTPPHLVAMDLAHYMIYFKPAPESSSPEAINTWFGQLDTLDDALQRNLSNGDPSYLCNHVNRGNAPALAPLIDDRGLPGEYLSLSHISAFLAQHDYLEHKLGKSRHLTEGALGASLLECAVLAVAGRPIKDVLSTLQVLFQKGVSAKSRTITAMFGKSKMNIPLVGCVWTGLLRNPHLFEYEWNAIRLFLRYGAEPDCVLQWLPQWSEIKGTRSVNGKPWTLFQHTEHRLSPGVQSFLDGKAAAGEEFSVQDLMDVMFPNGEFQGLDDVHYRTYMLA
ncbi:hypothetical protein B0T19DRAFT_276631 [Cercophora scortea]|uniref:NACHT domain-containing protein n=1 Tax=Cercophora scortea TaxID=314031 RepID=A0AAE0I7N8_9PEZI|nr:hypothetical protein B0T19DRAFT_276631 [Cercophora scortea]